MQERVFTNLELETIQMILDKFTEVQQDNMTDKSRHQAKHLLDGMLQGQDGQLDAADFKFVKTKEKQKLLLCNLIGVTLQLSRGNRIRASKLAEMLKKEASELKNYFKELDLGIEARKNEKTGEEDLMIFLNQKKKQAKKAEQNLKSELVGQKRERANTE